VSLSLCTLGTYRDPTTQLPNYQAHGVEIGGYDLIALSLTGKGFDAINPVTHQSAGSTCFASG
jgi:hypothetical protein